MFTTELILKATPWLVAIVMAAVAAVAGHFYVAEKEAFATYKGKVEGAIEQQKIALKAEDAKRERNLKETINGYEKKLDLYRGAGLRTYCLRYPDQCGHMPNPSAAAGQQVDDGAAGQCVAAQPDPGFIQACTDDAVKVTAFQDYCKRNNCPVE